TVGIKKLNVKKDELIDTILSLQEQAQVKETETISQNKVTTEAPNKEKRKRIHSSADSEERNDLTNEKPIDSSQDTNKRSAPDKNPNNTSHPKKQNQPSSKENDTIPGA